MLVRALCMALVLSGAADELVQTKIPPLRLRVPGAWTHSKDGDTHRFQSPSGDAYFLVNTGHTANKIDSQECVDKIVAAVGGQGWQKLSIAATPAARKVETLHNNKTNTDIKEATYVGCDGVTTWSIVLTIDARKLERYAGLGDKVAGSVEYLRAQ